MGDKKSFIVHEKWLSLFTALPDSDLGSIVKAMINYTTSGETGDINPLHQAILSMMIEQYEADKQNYIKTCERNRENIRKRWEKKNNTSVYERIPSNTVGYETIPLDTDMDRDKDMDMDMDMDMEKDMDNNNMSFSTKSPYKRKDDKSSQRESRIPKKELDDIVARWNTLPDPIPRLTVLKPGTKRYESLSARYDEYGIDNIMIAIEKVRKSSFLCGKSTKWFIKFDWFVLPNNFPKVLEGNYADKEEDQTPKPSRCVSIVDDMIAKGLLPI